MKKSISFTLSMVMCIVLCTSVSAAEQERIVIEVANEEEIMAFINSPEFDPHELYSFIQETPFTARSLCPGCGSNSYYGGVLTENISVQLP